VAFLSIGVLVGVRGQCAMRGMSSGCQLMTYEVRDARSTRQKILK
jgi:hypothetical protein